MANFLKLTDILETKFYKELLNQSLDRYKNTLRNNIFSPSLASYYLIISLSLISQYKNDVVFALQS